MDGDSEREWSLWEADDAEKGRRLFIGVENGASIGRRVRLILSRGYEPAYLTGEGWVDEPVVLEPEGVYSRGEDLYIELDEVLSLHVDEHEIVDVDINDGELNGVVAWEARGFDAQFDSEEPEPVPERVRPEELALGASGGAAGSGTASVPVDEPGDTAPPPPHPPPEPDGKPNGLAIRKVGLIAGVLIGVLLVALAGWLLWNSLGGDDDNGGTSGGETAADSSDGDTEGGTTDGETAADSADGDTGDGTTGGDTAADSADGDTEGGTTDGETVADSADGDTGDGTTGGDTAADSADGHTEGGEEDAPPDLLGDFRAALEAEEFDRARTLLNRLTVAGNGEAALIAAERAGGPDFEPGLFEARDDYTALDYHERACRSGAPDARGALERFLASLEEEGREDGLSSTAEEMVMVTIPAKIAQCGR